MSRLPLATLRRLYVEEGRPLPVEVERALLGDERAGARAVLDGVRRRRRANRAEGQRLRKMCRFERELWEQGRVHVAGVDEAGMSPLAGPVTAAAVILRVEWRHPGIDDSKRVDPERREVLAEIIRRECVSWALGFVEPEEIDRLNIYHAGLLAMRRAVEGLAVTPEHLLVDARRVDLDLPQDGIVKGDEKSLSIAAASILAKTARDARMVEYDGAYPGYGFAQHKGYPVPAHQEALRRLGPCPIHRRSFTRVREVLSRSGGDGAAARSLPGVEADR